MSFDERSINSWKCKPQTVRVGIFERKVYKVFRSCLVTKRLNHVLDRLLGLSVLPTLFLSVDIHLNLAIEMVITLKMCISDLVLIKPKCVSETKVENTTLRVRPTRMFDSTPLFEVLRTLWLSWEMHVYQLIFVVTYFTYFVYLGL